MSARVFACCKAIFNSESSPNSSSTFGRNSCSGGSSRRIVTGKPAISRKMPTKSPRCSGSSLSRAFSRAPVPSARIISRMAASRLSPKNMCSVRHKPIPSAPIERATRASCGVSAFARTVNLRCSSAHFISS